MSTEATVRDAILAAFADAGLVVNLRDYPYEFEHDELKGRYLAITVDNVLKRRAWSVFVTSADAPHASGNVWHRRYIIRINAYYGRESGAANLLVEHGRLLKAELKALDANLGGAVTLVEEISDLAVTVQGDLIVGELIWRVLDTRPTYD